MFDYRTMHINQIHYYNNGIRTFSTYVGRFKSSLESIRCWARYGPYSHRTLYYICKFFIFAVLGIILKHQKYELEDCIEKKKLSIKSLEEFLTESEDQRAIDISEKSKNKRYCEDHEIPLNETKEIREIFIKCARKNLSTLSKLAIKEYGNKLGADKAELESMIK